jgi:hypothetical protein
VQGEVFVLGASKAAIESVEALRCCVSRIP